MAILQSDGVDNATDLILRRNGVAGLTVTSTSVNFLTNGVYLFNVASNQLNTRITVGGNITVSAGDECWFQTHVTNGPGDRKRYRVGSNSAGNFTIDSINDAYTVGILRFSLDTAGNIRVPSVFNLTTGAGSNMHVSADGTFFRSTSSLKYKTEVKDITHGLAEVMSLRPVTYKGINDGQTVFGGLIAEEVHESGLTEFVQYTEDGNPDALSYGNMVSLAFKAIQEQQVIIESLKTRLTALEASNGERV